MIIRPSVKVLPCQEISECNDIRHIDNTIRFSVNLDALPYILRL